MLAVTGRHRRGGHGLGLAIVAHIVKRHGGTAVFVDGAGAHLEIALPSTR